MSGDPIIAEVYVMAPDLEASTSTLLEVDITQTD
jgi:hypothetical protein